ncbi:MAG: dihydroorotate dehydrogenase [bacterium]|jgi:dihydroorotate dehydrogenase (NAD+) catalytic subunit|nr:dihydroorotate dehydrogenase [Planctomycetota bacterium]HIL52120.1 dihydroorotate dehydrogenase [Planctomycetota bacterium]
MPSLAVTLGELQLANPILSASGTFGHGLEMEQFAPPERLGGLVSKTVTLRPRPGNPAPRIHETEAGFLNSIGLENRGLETYLAETLPEVAGADTRIFCNIGGESPEEYARLAALLDERSEIDALEINLSCPNVQGGRLPFSTDPALAERCVRAVREATSKPIFAKLSPNVSRIAELAVAVEQGGADGITAVNTLLGMQVDWRSGKPGLATVMGGYSGQGIKPVALRCAWECVQAVSIPVLGCGGIADADDVLEFLAVGCAAVQVGTASFSDPGLLGHLAADLAARLEAAGLESIAQVRGSLERHLSAK